MFISNILLILCILSHTTFYVVGFLIPESNFAFVSETKFHSLLDDDAHHHHNYFVKRRTNKRKFHTFQRFDNKKSHLYNQHEDDDNIHKSYHHHHPSKRNDEIGDHVRQEEEDLHLFWKKIRSPSFDYIQIQNTLPPSLSHLLSTPQRYAISLNKTIEEVQEIKRNYKYSVDDYRKQRRRLLEQQQQEQENEVNQVVDKTTTAIIGSSGSSHDDDSSIRRINRGKKEHELQCEIRYKYGRDPFVCPKCWTHEPICICQRARTISQTMSSSSSQLLLPPYTNSSTNIQLQKVIIWTHHEEWGKTSNTGSVIGVTLGDHQWCHVWMKGLKKHDEYMKELLDDELVVPIVLWPKLNRNKNERNNDVSDDDDVDDDRWTTIEELEQYMNEKNKEKRNDILSNQECKIVMIAIEGTWRNARRMIKKLPSHVKRLDIGEYLSVISNHHYDKKMDDHEQKVEEGGSSSILQPLRSQGDGSSKARVCTAEAIVAALVQFGLPLSEGMKLLELTRIKVDLTVRYQGKR